MSGTSKSETESSQPSTNGRVPKRPSAAGATVAMTALEEKHAALAEQFSAAKADLETLQKVVVLLQMLVMQLVAESPAIQQKIMAQLFGGMNQAAPQTPDLMQMMAQMGGFPQQPAQPGFFPQHPGQPG